MPEAFWMEEYRKKAALPDPVAQSGRGRQFEAVEFLYVARQAIELLDLRRDHDLLDVGCANGLLDIVLSGACRSLLAVEPVEDLASLARRNLAACPNATVAIGHGASLPAEAASFDRILVAGVIQLMSPADVRAMMKELHRVSRPSARVALLTVPDARRKDSFLVPYLESVQAATHLSAEQKAEIVARNRAAYWYDAQELLAWWGEQGGTGEIRLLSAADPDAHHRFHLLLSAGS